VIPISIDYCTTAAHKSILRVTVTGEWLSVMETVARQIIKESRYPIVDYRRQGDYHQVCVGHAPQPDRPYHLFSTRPFELFVLRTGLDEETLEWLQEGQRCYRTTQDAGITDTAVSYEKKYFRTFYSPAFFDRLIQLASVMTADRSTNGIISYPNTALSFPALKHTVRPGPCYNFSFSLKPFHSGDRH